MKRTLLQVFLLIVIALGAGLIYNSFHKPHLPFIAYNGEEMGAADSLAVNGNLEEINEPMMITLAQAYELFKNGEALFVDARSEEEFRNSHIPSAVSVSIDELSDPEPLLRSLNSSSYVTYCDGESCLLSTDLAYLMSGLGMEPVFVFHEGLDVWIANGFPLAREDQQ